MIRAAIIVTLIVALLADVAAARPWFYQQTHPRHHRHHQSHRPYDAMLCRDIIAAFDQLAVRDLDTFVKSVPDGKRKQALRCLARTGR